VAHRDRGADLLRGGALTLLRAGSNRKSEPPEEVEVQAGDVIVPELLHSPPHATRVAEASDAGAPLNRHLCLLRPDPARLDSWFLAGFLGADQNRQAAATAPRLSGSISGGYGFRCCRWRSSAAMARRFDA